MKKLFLLAAVAVFGLTSVNAQEFKGGVHLGLPTGLAGPAYSLAIGADVAYLWEVGDGFQAGATAGYDHFLGESEFNVDAFGVIPLGGAARYNVSDEIALGLDLGIALSTQTGGGSTVFFAPRAQYSVSEGLDIVLAYKGYENLGSFNLGVEFGL